MNIKKETRLIDFNYKSDPEDQYIQIITYTYRDFLIVEINGRIILQVKFGKIKERTITGEWEICGFVCNTDRGNYPLDDKVINLYFNAMGIENMKFN